MNRFAAFCFSAATIFACVEITYALSTPPNVGPVITNPMPNYDQYTDTTRAIDLSQFFSDPDSTAAATMTTAQGSITFTLDGLHAPATVENFLNYLNSVRYFGVDPTNDARTSTFFHRSVTNFVIQGGGFLTTANPNGSGTAQPTAVLPFPAVQNEPFISNTRGTIAMAKTSAPNSATCQWFINLSNNTGLDDPNVPSNTGGFTAFGHVTGNGMAVADAIAALGRVNAGSPFNELPVQNYTSPNPIRVPNLVSIPEFRPASPLTYSASISNPDVATVTASGGNLVVTTHQLGAAQITVTGFDLDGAGPVSQSFTVNVIAAPGRLKNISTRAKVGIGDDVLIAGFIIGGGNSKDLVVRGVGPSLSNAVANPLINPILKLRDSTAEISTNNDWLDAPKKETISDLGFAPHADRESAILSTFPTGGTDTGYTAIMEGSGQTTGVGLVEVFDADYGPGATIHNLSTRGRVGTGDDVMIGGVIIVGGDPKRLIFRAIGPSLANFGIASPLNDPTIRLFNSQGTVIDSNDDWQANPQAGEIQQANLQPSNAKESAILATLAPGGYTAIVSGNGDDPTGVGLVEVFQLP